MPIDYSKYPPNWKTEIVPAVRKRSGDCCERCKLKNKQIVWSIKLWIKDVVKYKYQSVWFSNENDAIREDKYNTVKPVKVVLTVAHLDHDEANWDVELDRLEHMCQICHLRYDALEKYRRSLKQ